MEEVKIVAMDNGRLMAKLPDGPLVPIRPFSNTAVFIDLSEELKVNVDLWNNFIPNKKETNHA